MVGFDLHTASNHRINHPQIRANLDDPTTLGLVRAFGAPFSIQARIRDGSLRQAASERGKTILLYEAGQANRFDDDAVEYGVVGIMRTLRELGMIDVRLPRATPTKLIRRTRWMRARRGGIADIEVKLADHVSKGQRVASDIRRLRQPTYPGQIDRERLGDRPLPPSLGELRGLPGSRRNRDRTGSRRAGGEEEETDGN